MSDWERLRRSVCVVHAHPRDKLKKLIHDTLGGRSETRADALMVLSAMAPLIVELGGQEAALGIVNAIRRVGKWWA